MKVLVTATNYDVLCGDGLKMLEDNGCEVILSEYGRPPQIDELKPMAKDVDACIANMEPWNKISMDNAPKLKAIARFGVGYDNVDLEEAKKHGVVVTNCPGVNAPAVAEHDLTLMLALCHGIINGKGNSERSDRHLLGKTIGIVGLGNIGRCFAKLLKGFDAEVIAWNRTPRPELADELGIRLVTLDELWSKSDFINITVANNSETHHIVNEESIAKMKDGVIIVNGARGPLVDEQAMVRALKSGKVGGFAADVLCVEPFDLSSPLMELDNFICTPHASGQTYENYKNTGIMTAKAVLDVLSGREPANRRV